MARRTFQMIDLVEIYVHWYAGRSQAQIADSLGLDRKTVRKYLAPVAAEGLVPGGPPVMTEADWRDRAASWVPALVDKGLRQVTGPAIDVHRDYITAQLAAHQEPDPPPQPAPSTCVPSYGPNPSCRQSGPGNDPRTSARKSRPDRSSETSSSPLGSCLTLLGKQEPDSVGGPHPGGHARRPHGELRDRRGGELRDREPLKPGELRDR